MGLSDCSDPGVAGDLPPPEIFCNLLVGCDTFPQDKVCGLAIDGCWSAYTFDNDCQLSLYNCEHPSTRKHFFLIKILKFQNEETICSVLQVLGRCMLSRRRNDNNFTN